MTNVGWFKLFRDIQDMWIWKIREPYCKRAAYMDLLLMCNYKKGTFNPKDAQTSIDVEPGDLFTSMAFLSNRWKWSRRKVENFLKTLMGKDIIFFETYSFGTYIKLYYYERSWIQGASKEHQKHSNGSNEGSNEGNNKSTTRVAQYKKVKNEEEGQKNQEPKNTAKRSGFDWGNLE